MPKAEPILINAQVGEISRAKFRRLPKEERIEMMRAWFHHRYEDPVHHMPYISAEGGYQYITGGPYDAGDELHGMFYNLAPEKWINELVEELEEDTTDWAGTFGDDWADQDDQRGSVTIGSPEDQKLREEILSSAESVTKLIAERPKPAAGMIGHNQPPEPIDVISEYDLAELSESVGLITEEVKKPKPDLADVAERNETLRSFETRLKGYLGHKADVLLEEFVKQLGKNLGHVPWIAMLYGPLHELVMSIAHWLYLLAR